MKKIVTFLLVLIVFVTAFIFSNHNAYAKGISAPSKFETSSRAYSTKLTWTKVKGISGYVVYHRTANSNYKKVKTITSNTNSYTHYNLKANANHYYRIKSYIKKNGNTTYSNYSKTIIVKTKVATEPEIYTFMNDKTNKNTTVLAIAVKNMSNKSIYIQNYGHLIDKDYYDYDRDLTLAKLSSNQDKITHPKSITIKPKKSAYLLFDVDGSPTWYDSDTTIQFYFYYEGQLYQNTANVDSNSDYINLDILE